MPQNTADGRLAVVRAQQEAAFARFVREHGRSLFGTAYLLTGSGEAAEELVQATLVDLVPKWQRVEAATSPVAYVRRALVNRFLTSKRDRRVTELPAWRLPDHAVDGDFTDRIADRQLLWSLLGDLPQRQRAAIVLRFFHDQDDDAIAAALECRVSTVRSIISRGVAAMRTSRDATTCQEGAR